MRQCYYFIYFAAYDFFFFSSAFTVQPVPTFVSPGALRTETSVDTKNEENREQKDNLKNDKKQSLHKTGG